MNTPLIVSGFYSDERSYARKREFLDIWLANTPGEIVIVDNSVRPLVLTEPRVRIIRINNNIGFYQQFKGCYRPYLLGHTVSWMSGVLVAYSENRDMIYKEQDCLWFGEALNNLVQRAAELDLIAQFGYAKSSPSRVESCLFWIRCDFLIEFMTKYCEISEGDGLVTCEEKFNRISRYDPRITAIIFGVGRDRPLPKGEKTWFAQKFSVGELKELKETGLI